MYKFKYVDLKHSPELDVDVMYARVEQGFPIQSSDDRRTSSNADFAISGSFDPTSDQALKLKCL